jgi:hypothetical protein
MLVQADDSNGDSDSDNDGDTVMMKVCHKLKKKSSYQ